MRVGGVIRAERQRHHLDVVSGLGDLQRLLHRVLVQLGQQAVRGGPVDRAVGGEARSPVASGTYLTRTTIFISLFLLGEASYYSPVT